MEINNLVFAGSGANCFGYCGAVSEMNEQGLLSDLDRIAGSSTGSIIAALVALKKSPSEITQAFKEYCQLNTEEQKLREVRQMVKFFSHFGYKDGGSFLSWFQRIGAGSLTFLDLHNSDLYSDLYIIATNLSLQKPELFGWKTTPDITIAQAVYISIICPLYFQAVIDSKGNLLVGGSLSLNYPLRLFDTEKANEKTLGFMTKTTKANKPKKVDNLIDYVKVMENYHNYLLGNQQWSEEDLNRTILIDCLGLQAMDFKQSVQKRDLLVANGRQAVIDYFKKEEHV